MTNEIRKNHTTNVMTRRMADTYSPTGAWATQQARQPVWKLDDRKSEFYFLVHDQLEVYNLNHSG